jgi:hypothetical protein
MEDEELKSVNLKRLCQAVSANDEPCDIRRPYDVQGAVGGSAISTLRMKSGIHVRCRRERKAARHSKKVETLVSQFFADIQIKIIRPPQYRSKDQLNNQHHQLAVHVRVGRATRRFWASPVVTVGECGRFGCRV